MPHASAAGMIGRSSLRVSATLLLVGQLLYILITQLHADGDANNHPEVFVEYADSGNWTAVHVGQFAAMAIMLAGLFALFFALDSPTEVARWTGRLGAASAAVTLALYGALQAVDGVALKQAVSAWAAAPEAERTARLASAEAIRWLEWGMRGYQNFALGMALLLFAALAVQMAPMPRAIAFLMVASGISHLLQGWVLGSVGFTQVETYLIILGFVLNLAWMAWLVVVSWRMPGFEDSLPDRRSRGTVGGQR
jgi:hypothetical protein